MDPDGRPSSRLPKLSLENDELGQKALGLPVNYSGSSAGCGKRDLAYTDLGSGIDLFWYKLRYMIEIISLSSKNHAASGEPDSGGKNPKKQLTRNKTRYTFMSAIH
jgi:hypothetical protein